MGLIFILTGVKTKVFMYVCQICFKIYISQNMQINKKYQPPVAEVVSTCVSEVLCSSPNVFESTMPEVDREEFQW